MPDDQTQKYMTVAEVAKLLNISTKSVYRYLDENMFENYLIIQRPKRVYYRFPPNCIDAFIAKYSGGVQPADREKRAYNKRSVKGKHKKKRRKVA